MKHEAVLNNLTQVQPESISTLIVRQLYSLFENGILNPGDKLPSESAMSRQLGVNRLQLRETIKQLEFFGIFRSVPQSGTYLSSLGKNTLNGLFSSFLHKGTSSYRDLTVVRTVLECKSVALVVQNASDDEIVTIERAHTGFRESIVHGQRGFDEDIYFHLRLAEFSHNSVLESILAQLYSEIYAQTITIPDIPQKRLTDSITEHEMIINAVKSRSLEDAVKGMAEHMRKIQDFFA